MQTAALASNKPAPQFRLDTATERYARCVENSKRIRWDIDADVLRGRRFDFTRKFLPDGLTRADRLDFLDVSQRRFMSQLQGRTYANMFGLVERFIAPKILEVSRDHWLGDQVAFESLLRFTDEELKHQELFRRVERMIGEGMPPGYRFLPQPNEVAAAVLGKSTWAVLALVCHIELFVLQHYRASIEPDPNLSELFKDILLHHWKEESQHAILDELEWRREDAKITKEERDAAVEDLIALVGAVDGLLQLQAAEDARYFVANVPGSITPSDAKRIEPAILEAYRWQYIVSGVQDPRFNAILGSMIAATHAQRIGDALAPLMP